MNNIKLQKINFKKVVIYFFGFFFLAWYGLSLPRELFKDPLCTVMLDREGRMLGARIAADGQWRFPPGEEIPSKFEHAILVFEDRHFYRHPGVNPVSMFKALVSNARARRFARGGSTISMQVIRMHRKNRPRVLGEKLLEMILATRLEIRYSKREILAMYAANAPFGSNVVGLEAASWRYFGCNPSGLSWGEAACLAVLPNAPSLVHPGRNREALLAKRDRLINRLQALGIIDELTASLAKDEPLPGKPLSLPSFAPHLLERVHSGKGSGIHRVTLDRDMQSRVTTILHRRAREWIAGEVHNAAALVLDVETGEVLAYVGNIPGKFADKGHEVDIVMARRSTGSLLKPFLFAAMLEDGSILPTSLVPDIPTRYGNFRPENFNLGYEGVVPAWMALSRSLNIPSVRMLHEFGVQRFHDLLTRAGMGTLDFPASHYGLSLVLGGAEGRLWDLTAMYASMARVLKHFTDSSGNYFDGDTRPPRIYLDSPLAGNEKTRERDVKTRFDPVFTAGSIWLTFEALVEANRPEMEFYWKHFDPGKKIAWKTGTSFGNRDAWAIGTNARYTVGVWVGNATGEGRPGLTGAGSAAPAMFDIFHSLPGAAWFSPPLDNLARYAVCRHSGFKAGRYCPDIDTLLVHPGASRAMACPYHLPVRLDASGKYRVHSGCYPLSRMKEATSFVLPPAREWFYRKKNPGYQGLPPLYPGCQDEDRFQVMEMIYPEPSARVVIPREIDGQRGFMVLELAHSEPGTVVYWHLDQDYLGSTGIFHTLACQPSPGWHTLTLVDAKGRTLKTRFEVIE